MGNYIYGHITPKSGISNESVEDIKTEAVEATVEATNDATNEKVEEAVEATNEKSIHPYLVEYGTVMYDSIMINNTIYKYTKNN
jgi:hypothetical protein